MRALSQQVMVKTARVSEEGFKTAAGVIRAAVDVGSQIIILRPRIQAITEFGIKGLSKHWLVASMDELSSDESLANFLRRAPKNYNNGWLNIGPIEYSPIHRGIRVSSGIDMAIDVRVKFVISHFTDDVAASKKAGQLSSVLISAAHFAPVAL
jgi:hypothetical protein